MVLISLKLLKNCWEDCPVQTQYAHLDQLNNGSLAYGKNKSTTSHPFV